MQLNRLASWQSTVQRKRNGRRLFLHFAPRLTVSSAILRPSKHDKSRLNWSNQTCTNFQRQTKTFARFAAVKSNNKKKPKILSSGRTYRDINLTIVMRAKC